MIRNPFRRYLRLLRRLPSPSLLVDDPELAPTVGIGEFRRVALPAPNRNCVTCVSFAYRWGRRSQHCKGHQPSRADHLPEVWRVTATVAGDLIPAGTTLRRTAACHQVFYEWGGSDSIDWLFEVTDGPSAGEVFYVFTHLERDEDGGCGMEWGAPGFPLWPEGLEPVGWP